MDTQVGDAKPVAVAKNSLQLAHESLSTELVEVVLTPNPSPVPAWKIRLKASPGNGPTSNDAAVVFVRIKHVLDEVVDWVQLVEMPGEAIVDDAHEDQEYAVNSMLNVASLENPSIHELHEAFRNTYGRDTSAKNNTG
ncbi:unnamed protein product [Sphagnum compactum]